MKPGKRRQTATTPAAGPTGTVRVGFSPEAKEAFDALPAKWRDGLRRKLYDFGGNPAIGKPLVGALRGYHRVTYGRVRSIAEAIAKVADGIVIVHVLYLGLRKEGAADDPYELAAAKAIRSGDPDAIEALEKLVQQMLSGNAPDAEGED
jgi:hypothetical protein